MIRQFSIIRRRPNYVDMVIPRQTGVDGYRIQSSTNFDGSWTTRFTSNNSGFVDGSINPMLVDSQNLNGNTALGPPVRVVFDPANYSLTDTKPFWLRFVPVTGGSAGTPGAPTLVLPFTANHGVGLVAIHGTAPNGADSTAALQIDLPRQMQDFRIHNEEAATSLYVSFEQDGPEVQLKFGPQEQFTSILGTQSSIWVRGGGATAAFSATFTAAFPR